MNYNIKYNHNIPNGVQLDSELEVLNVFFHSFSQQQLIVLILGLIDKEGYIGDPKGLILYHELDAEDIANGDIFEPDEVKVYHHYFGELILKKYFFINICIDYFSKINEANNKNGTPFSAALEKFINIYT